MPLASPSDSVLLVVDMQPTFLKPIWEAGKISVRTSFLIQIAKLIGVPVLATEQYPERMGGTDPAIDVLLGEAGAHKWSKRAFSCALCSPCAEAISCSGRRQCIVTGIETHICVNQTVHHLLDSGYEVFVVEDAVSARTPLMHANGVTRMRESGAVIAHSESIAYEWMGSSEHPAFREMLELVKASNSGSSMP